VKEIRTEIYIEASAEWVWRKLTDFAAYPKWNPFIRLVERTELAAGACWKVCIQLPQSEPRMFRPIVQKVIPAAELRWRGKLWVNGLFDGEHAFVIEPHRTGIRFVQSERFSGLLAPILAPMIAAKTRQGFEAMNRSLKNLAEAKRK